MRDESHERLARRDSLANSRSSSDAEDDVLTNKEAARAVRNARESVEKNIHINHYLREVMGSTDPRRARRRAIDRRYRHLFVAEELRKLNEDAAGCGGYLDSSGIGASSSSSHPMLSSSSANKDVSSSNNNNNNNSTSTSHHGATSLQGQSQAGALGDTTPLHIDRTISFASVGGLPEHIVTLREMVLLPLLYPDVLRRLRVTPPRGVLFVGPPGTGKTLMARALANEGSRCGGQQITFFMRKGADILSKWVGESERQLHLLFDEARRQQPSIIFFDEIDGLAPTRHAKTEQTHAALVATLLALLDGLDDRGQVVVIGATNRPDTIDPALRRPGRFDQELLFPTPDAAGRRHILRILTRSMSIQPASPLSSHLSYTHGSFPSGPRSRSARVTTATTNAAAVAVADKNTAKDDASAPYEAILSELVRHTEGYTGADLRALCTEAGLHRLRTTLPQIYTSDTRLGLSPAAMAQLTIRPEDFFAAAQRLRPSLRRGGGVALGTAAAAVEEHVDALLHGTREAVLRRLDAVWPAVARARRRGRRDCDDVAQAVRALASFPIPHPRQPLVLLMQVRHMRRSKNSNKSSSSSNNNNNSTPKRSAALNPTGSCVEEHGEKEPPTRAGAAVVIKSDTEESGESGNEATSRGRCGGRVANAAPLVPMRAHKAVLGKVKEAHKGDGV